jgi:hypothetical protein
MDRVTGCKSLDTHLLLRYDTGAHFLPMLDELGLAQDLPLDLLLQPVELVTNALEITH